MKNIFCIINALLFSVNSYLFPQTADSLKSLEQEILAQEDTNLEIIIKSRNMILENLYAGNMAKIEQISRYLEEKFKDSEYLPVWYVEKLLLSYCIKDYKYILGEIKLPPQDNDEDYARKINPPEDQLGSKLGEYLSNKYVMAEREISSSDINEEEKDVLILSLKFLLYRFGETPFVSQEELNVKSDLFLSRYPNSRYTDFIRENIRYVLKLSDFGWGIVLSAGKGELTGELKNYFAPYTAVSLNFELSYKKWYLYCNVNIGIGEANNDFTYNGNWKKGTALNYNMLGASIGRIIYEDEYFRIIPNIGLAGTEISPPPAKVKNGEIEDLSLGYTTAFSLGFTADWKVYSFQERDIFGLVYTDIFIRLTGGYVYPSFQREDDRFMGNTYFITLGLGGFGRALIRDL